MGLIRPEAIGRGFLGDVRDTVASAELDGEIVAYDEERRVVHKLNRTAAAIFSRLDGTVTLDQVVDDVAEAFATSPDAIRDDIVALVRELGAKNLLHGVEAAPSAGPDGVATAEGAPGS